MSFRIFALALWVVSVLFLLLTAISALLLPLNQLPLLGTMVGRPHLIDKAVPLLILLLFAWILVEIWLKAKQVRRQHATIPLFHTLLEQADKNQYEPKAFNLKEPRAVRRADLIIECSRRDPSSLHEAVPGAAALDATTLAAGYGPLHVYAWILPVLGFIGTASGMASAIDGFRDALRGGQGQVQALAAQLGQTVIPGLSAAFGTTMLALSATLVAYLCTSALRSWDQEALDQLDRLCIVLLSRTPQPEGPEGKKIVEILESIMEQLSASLSLPLTFETAAKAIANTARALDKASGTLEGTAEGFGKAAANLEETAAGFGKAAATLDSAGKALQDSASAPYHLTITRGRPS